MPTTTTTSIDHLQPIPGCPTCGGTGWDDAFASTCDCLRFVGRSPLAERLHGANAGQTTYSTPQGRGDGTGAARPVDGPTEKQLAFLAKLAGERGVDVPTVSTKRAASQEIDRLMAMPKAPAAAVADRPQRPTTGLDLSGMESGLYAVPGGDTRLKVKIDVVTSGKWAGWVFVKDGAEYGQGRRYGSQRPGATYRGDIADELAVIAADPIAAMAAYGHLTGTCGRCAHPLEDETSVARGIGPYCARILGIA